jgi:hypothetical protein
MIIKQLKLITMEKNEFAGQKFRIETMLGKSVVQGTATIKESHGALAWGLAEFGSIQHFHTYFLTIERGKVTAIKINPKEIFDDGRGGFKTLGMESEVRTLYEVMIGSLCEADALKKRRKETEVAMGRRLDDLAQKNTAIRDKRLELKNKITELCTNKSLDQQMTDPEIKKLAGELSILNILHPERRIVTSK